jgi:hypothetical protein
MFVGRVEYSAAIFGKSVHRGGAIRQPVLLVIVGNIHVWSWKEESLKH